MNLESQSQNKSLFHSNSWVLLGLTFLFFVTRITNLTLLPIFNDEAVYLNWARMIKDGEAGPFVSILADNKKPLQILLTSLNMEIFADPLTAGRFASTLAGWICLLGIFFTGRRLCSQLVGTLAALTYIVCPYALLFDRLAHESSLLSAAMVWNLWLTLTLIQKDKIGPKHFNALILTTGLGLLTLSTALLFLFIPILFKIIHIRDKTFTSWRFFGICYLAGFFIASLPYLNLYLTMEDYQIKNIIIPDTHSLRKASTLNLILGMPTNIWKGLKEVLEYFWFYLTPPIFLSAFIGLTLISWQGGRMRFPLLAYFFIPTLILLGTAGSGFSRYYFFCTIPLLLGTAFFYTKVLIRIKKSFLALNSILLFLSIFTISLIPSILLAYDLISKPQSAGYIKRDRYQFVTSQFSGYGIPESMDYLKEQAENKKIAVFTTTNWGNPADAAYSYLSSHPNIELYSSYWIFTQPLLPPHIKAIDIHQRFTGKFLMRLQTAELPEVYFIRRTSPGFQRNHFIQANPILSLVKLFKKPDSTFFVEVYKMKK